MTPLRLIFSDTMTGETDWHDVQVSEFSPEAVIEHLKQKMGWTTEEPPITCAAWVITPGWASTACFIMQMADVLIHGVCYTIFDPNHNPLS